MYIKALNILVNSNFVNLPVLDLGECRDLLVRTRPDGYRETGTHVVESIFEALQESDYGKIVSDRRRCVFEFKDYFCLSSLLHNDPLLDFLSAKNGQIDLHLNTLRHHLRSTQLNDTFKLLSNQSQFKDAQLLYVKEIRQFLRTFLTKDEAKQLCRNLLQALYDCGIGSVIRTDNTSRKAFVFGSINDNRNTEIANYTLGVLKQMLDRATACIRPNVLIMTSKGLMPISQINVLQDSKPESFQIDEIICNWLESMKAPSSSLRSKIEKAIKEAKNEVIIRIAVEAVKDAEGIRLTGEAKAAAEKAWLLAPVETQITLAQEIGENEGYQQYLITVKQVEASQAVGLELAKAMQGADLKIIANAGDPQTGIAKLGDLFTAQGGTNLTSMLAALAQSDEGKALINRFAKPAA